MVPIELSRMLLSRRLPRRRPLLHRIVMAAALLVGTAPAAARAQSGQDGVQLEIVVPGGAVSLEGASVLTTNLLHDAKTRELLRSGFPARMHYRVELWRESGWFDDLEGTSEWDVLVSYDPTSNIYRVVRQSGGHAEDFGGFPTVDAAAERIERPIRVPLRPQERHRQYYYNFVVDVKTLDVSDLDELQRWLRGEFQPAVRGRNNPISALRNGVGTLLSRILGGQQRHYERRSETFATP